MARNWQHWIKASPARSSYHDLVWNLLCHALLLATAAIALRELVLVLSWLGIESPEVM
jgi:hypothetical protein